MSAPGETFLKRKEAAKYLTGLGCAVSVRYLEEKAHFGGGPAFYRTGDRIVRYAKSDLDAWMKTVTKRVE